MTPRQIDLVRSSCAQVSILAHQPAAIFLDHLFAADASLRGELLDDDRLAAERLMRMLNSMVYLLDRPGELQGAFEVLGARLGDPVSTRRRQQAFTAALMKTLETCLQSSFTPDVREAWQALSSLVGQCLAQRVPQLSLAAA